MLKRLLLIWFVANFVIVGLVSMLMGGWYLSNPPLIGLSLELALVMVPNLALPIWALGRPAFHADTARRESLGWRWPGIRALVWGVGAFAAIFGANTFVSRLLGNPIPYISPAQWDRSRYLGL